MERLETRPRLYEDAFEAIRQHIAQRRLRPGDPLPSERQLQQQLGISRASVREALRVLQSVGLVEARQGRGLFVKELDLRPLVDAFVGHLDLLDGDAATHLLELRQILELGAVELAAKLRTPDDLTAMAAILEAMRRKIARDEAVLEEDLGFHDLLVRATHNPVLEHLYSCLTPFLVAVRQDSPHHDRLIYVTCLQDHMAIYRAVSDQDAGLAMRLMQEHLVAVREQLRGD